MGEDRLAETRARIEQMIAHGWSAAAIATFSGISPITVGNLRSGKAQRVTEQVSRKIAALRVRIENGEIEMPRRGRKSASGGTAPAAALPRQTAAVPNKTSDHRETGTTARSAPSASPGSDFGGMISTRYVPVDIEKLQEMIDRLIARFTAAAEELETIKSQLKL